MRSYSEEELIRLLRDKRPSVFSYLFTNYRAALYSIIIRIIPDEQIAEDVLQEAFVLIWNNISQYDSSKGRFFTWMAIVTRNRTIDVLRSRNYRDRLHIDTDEFAGHEMPDNGQHIFRFDYLGIKNHLLYLRSDHKQLINLAYFYGYTQQEIATQLNIPIGTVKTRISSALKELRKLLAEDPGGFL